ncbi:MAG: hypothetical protein HOC71_09845 [Candidatus Latescibacteria bacterium]|nr:hypothetical protein [Candidatus Latescibacterota bacterium]
MIECLDKYKITTNNLCTIETLLAYWGIEKHQNTLSLPFKHLVAQIKNTSNSTPLNWYPVILLFYSGGIAAVASNKYDNLRVLMQTNVVDPEYSHRSKTLILSLSNSLTNLRDSFKKLSGYEEKNVPQNEYLYSFFKPIFDDLLFISTDYEYYFDRFEVFLALEHAEQYSKEYDRGLGPIGRFGYKFSRVGDSDPFHQLLAEAESYGESWQPIKAGLFKGSYERFKEVATEFSKILSKLYWH